MWRGCSPSPNSTRKRKTPWHFPTRLFTLPVSTPFLFWWLVLAGQAAVVLYGVGLFRAAAALGDIRVYQNCFGWMTLLALAQGIVWALAAWPLTRMLFLSAVFLASLFLRRRDIFESPLSCRRSLFWVGAGSRRPAKNAARSMARMDWERALRE
jgi:hypothetical protein